MKELLHRIGRLFGREKTAPVPFKVLFAEFKRSLELNNQILDLIAEANDKLSGDYIFGERYIRTTCEQLTDLVRQLIVVINHLTNQKYIDLFTSFHLIEQDLQAILQGRLLNQVEELVLPYSEVSRDLIDSVGGKNAHIAEIGSLLGLRIPDGFAITTTACTLFMEENGLKAPIAEIEAAWQRGELPLESASGQIQKMILAAPLPDRLRAALRREAARVADQYREITPCFAVRSSALGEDEFSSFAGQYRSLLNVPLDEVPQAYREVLASLYNGEAMEYRQKMDFRPHEVVMSAACQIMVPAKASGVLYTRDPVRPEGENMIVSSAWGLGEPIVSGAVPTDTFVLSRRPPHDVLESKIVRKDQTMVLRSCGGLDVDQVKGEDQAASSLNSEQLRELAAIGMRLEKHFRRPQDIEFAVDPRGRVVVLQSRQLRLLHSPEPRVCDLNGLSRTYPVLLRGKGVAAMEGIALGPAWLVSDERSLDDCPVGAIVVARYASPQLARLIDRAAGFITDIGSTTGHLATVAREFRIPALFNTEEGTALIKDGQEITLDTECLTIYAGLVQELQQYALHEEPIEEMYEYRLLRRVLKKIEPLNLVDPSADNFTPQGCRTYHDLTRFVHEKAVETIIDLNFYHAHDRDAQSGRLLWDYPIDLVLIDVGGGISGEHPGGVRPEQISSLPMQALVRGMTHPGIWDMAPVSVDLGSFMASMTRTTSSHNERPEDVGRNLAVVSAEYMNINFRLGYHFTVIDAYLSDNVLDNHIYFRFSGGVTETVRRSRRTRMLAKILAHYDFLCETHGDIVVARLKRMDRESMLERLFLLGLLVGFTRQLDVKMVNDGKIDEYAEQLKRIMEESHGQ